MKQNSSKKLVIFNRSITKNFEDVAKKDASIIKEKDERIEIINTSLNDTSNKLEIQIKLAEKQQNEIKELKEMLETEIKKREESNEREQEIDLEHGKLKRELRKSEQEKKALESSHKEMTNNFESIISTKNISILQLEDDVKSLREELGKVKNQANKVQRESDSELKTMRNKYQIKQQDLESEIIRIAQSKTEENNKVITDYESKIRLMEQATNLLKNEVKNKDQLWQEKLDNKENEWRNYESKIKNLEDELKVYKGKMEETKSEIARQFEIISSKDEEIKYYKEKLDANDKELNKVNIKLEEYAQRENVKDASESSIHIVNFDKKNIEDDLEKEREDNERLRNEITKIKQENFELKKKQKVVPSFNSIELQSLKKTGPMKDSLDELRDDFNKNMQIIDESIIKAKVKYKNIIG